MTEQGAKIKEFHSTGELASFLGATLKGSPEIQITGLGTLEEAGPGQLSFLTGARYAHLASQSNASALIVPPSFAHLEHTLLICSQPDLAMARVAHLFSKPLFLNEGIDKSAHIGSNCEFGSGVRIGPLAHVGSNCRLGSSTRICGSCYVGNDVCIGDDCMIYPSATILDGCQIGNRVIIHSGAVVGSDGFGFVQDDKGRHQKIPQIGVVQIDDDVEIGANCTIDRARFGKTWIQRGTKIDNLVQIAHNVVVGEDCILISQVGISGSTKLGNHVILAGQVGLVGHIEIGDRVRIGAKSGVPHSVKAGEDVSGIPAIPHKEFLKMLVHMRRLPEFREELRQLKAKINELEKAKHRD